MPIPLDDAAAATADLAGTKVCATTDPVRYLWLSVLAGAFVGLAVVLLVTVSAPLAAVGHPFTRLVQASVFGLALTLIVFAGAELFTGNTMVMVQGVLAGRVRWSGLAAVWGLSFVGNVVGSVGLALVVHAGGTVTGPVRDVIEAITTAKTGLDGGQLFWRAVLCNALVCLALWMASRAATDGAKLAVLWWALLAFVGSAFEHSIANVTLYSLGALGGVAAWSDLGRNLAWTVPGNLVGGALLVGAGYGWLGRLRPASAEAPAERPAESPAPAPAPALAAASR